MSRIFNEEFRASLRKRQQPVQTITPEEEASEAEDKGKFSGTALGETAMHLLAERISQLHEQIKGLNQTLQNITLSPEHAQEPEMLPASSGSRFQWAFPVLLLLLMGAGSVWAALSQWPLLTDVTQHFRADQPAAQIEGSKAESSRSSEKSSIILTKDFGDSLQLVETARRISATDSTVDTNSVSVTADTDEQEAKQVAQSWQFFESRNLKPLIPDASQLQARFYKPFSLEETAASARPVPEHTSQLKQPGTISSEISEVVDAVSEVSVLSVSREPETSGLSVKQELPSRALGATPGSLPAVPVRIAEGDVIKNLAASGAASAIDSIRPMLAPPPGMPRAEAIVGVLREASSASNADKVVTETMRADDPEVSASATSTDPSFQILNVIDGSLKI